MKHTTKLLLFNILLSAPALQAMGSMRTFGARVFKAASASAAKFKMNTQAFKAHKQPFVKPFGFKDGGKQGGYKKFAHTAAVMPLVKVGALYGVYDKVKEWCGYGKPTKIEEKSFTVDLQTCTVENLHKYPEHIQDFINFSLKFMHIDEKYLLVALQLIKNKPELTDQFAEQALNLFEQISIAYQSKEYFISEAISHIERLSAILMESCMSSNKIERLGRLQQVHRAVFFRDIYRRMESLSQTTPFIKGLMHLIDTDSKSLDALLQPKGKSLLEFAYIRADESTKKILEEKMQKLVTKKYKNFVFLPEGMKFNEKTLQFIDQSKYPLWAYGVDKRWGRGTTQTEAHINAHPSAQKQFAQLSPELKQLMFRIHNKEAQELAKGNYVFYHGQKWNLHLFADLYKQLWNITRSEKVGNDFSFLRFNQQEKIENFRADSLFLNHALFGNSQFAGNSSMYYFLKNSNVSIADLNPEELFKANNLQAYYSKYAEEIQNITQLHSEASQYGNMLLVSVPENKLKWVLPTINDGCIVPVNCKGMETSDTKTVLETLKKNPKAIYQQRTFKYGDYTSVTYNRDSDGLEYILPLNTQYALDPKNGPRIYQFNAADKEKLKKYTEARDALFAKIKQDFEQDKATPRYYMPK